jgi:V-type H+-transporting ATPase subunit H
VLQVLIDLCSTEPGALQAFKFLFLLQTINNLVQGPSINARDVGVQALEALLPRPEVRNAVWKMPTLISGYVSE